MAQYVPVKILRTLPLAVAGLFCGIATNVNAQSFSWDGDNASGNFLNANNWFGNNIPSFSFSGSLSFAFRNNPSQLNQFYDFADWANCNDIIWETTWGADTTFNGNGNGLNFKQRLENKSSKTVTIGTMNLSGGKDGVPHIELNPVNGDLILNGNIYNDNNLRYKVYGSSSKMLTVNRALGGNANVGIDIEGYSLVKIASAQTMGSSATYNIKQGELWISGSGSLASGSTVNLGEANANTAKLYLEGANDGHAITVANSGGTKVIGVLDTSGARTYSGNITLNGGVNLEAVQSGATVDFAGILSGSSGATISGAGTVKLSGINSFTGGTTVNSGTLLFGNNDRLANSGAFTINGGTANLGGFSETVGAVSINGGVVTNGTLSGSGYTAQAGDVSAILAGSGIALTKNGSGILYLSGANTYSGTTSVNAGILEIRDASALGASSSGTTVASGAALNIYQASSGITVANEVLTVNGTGLNNLNGALRNTGGNNAWNGAITLGSNTRINADTTGSSGSLTLGGNLAAGANVLFLGAMGGTNGNTGGNIAANGAISGAGNTQNGTTTSIFKDGSGTLTLGGANDYTGDTRIFQGNLTVSGSGSLGSGSDVYIASGGSLSVNSSVTVASVQEWTNSNSGTIAIGSGATLTINGADRGTIFQNSISGAGGLTMAGSGNTTLGLFGTQSYTGATTVSGGKLSTGVALASSGVTVSGGTFETTSANILGDTATVTVNSGTYSVGGNDTIGALSGTGGTISLSNNRLTTTVASGSSSYTGGTISGTGGGITKAGSGTFSLGGTHTYTGATTVDAGELRMMGVLSSSSLLNVNAGATLSGTGTIGGATTISGIHSPGTSPGIQTFSSNLTYNPGSTLSWELTTNTSSPGARGTSYDGVDLGSGANLTFAGSTKMSLLFNSAGSSVNWTDTFWSSDKSWLVYDLNGGSISGTNNFSVDSINWVDSGGRSFSQFLPGSSFSVSVSGQDLNLIYTIPEPSTYALLALSALGLAGHVIRRRRR